MQPALLTRWVLILAASYPLFFLGMGERGLVGPDEPRYASIAREMAESGDWVTPRLEGEPWFEKPALLYWLGASAHRLGLQGDRAIRLPAMLISTAFLLFFHWRLSRYFSLQAADYATLILATSAGWVAFSQVGVFDMPLAATVGTAMLLLLPWVEQPEQDHSKPLLAFGALLGLGMLAKGLVALALAALAILPVCYRRGWKPVARDLLHPRVVAPAVAVAGPWYLLCYLRNGSAFLEEFFVRHHFARLYSADIQHVEPFWFFGPVLLVGMLPWTPLLALYPNQEMRRDPKTQFLLGWALTTFLFFSIPTNKLAGYLLPALPPIAALMGIRLQKTSRAVLPLLAVALLLALTPVAENILPAALADGLGRAWPPTISSVWLPAIFVAFAGVTAWVESRGKRPFVLALLGLSAIFSFTLLKINVFPPLDRAAGARAIWLAVEATAGQTCLGEVRRHVDYGLSYYSARQLPDCSATPRSYRIEGDPPRVTSSPPVNAP